MADRDPMEEMKKAFALFDDDDVHTLPARNKLQTPTSFRPEQSRSRTCGEWRASWSVIIFVRASNSSAYLQGEVLSEDELQAMIDEFDKVLASFLPCICMSQTPLQARTSLTSPRCV